MIAPLIRFLPHIGLALALGFAVWWIDDQGYDRAMAERDAANTAMLIQIKDELRQSEARLTDEIATIATSYQAQREGIARAGASLQPIIIGEINRDPRLSDPAAGLTVGMLSAINRARAIGPCATTTAGGIECAVSPAPPVQGTAIADLALADFDAALGYADCAARHAGAVNAYLGVREEALRWNDSAKSR